MNDELEDRIAGSYGHLEPEDGLRESVLRSLGDERVTASPAFVPTLVAITVLGVALALVAIVLPGPVDLPPAPVSARFVTDGDAEAVARVMAKRLEVLGVSGAEAWAGEEPGVVLVHLPPEAEDPAIESTLLRPGTLEFRIVIEDPDPGEGRSVERLDGTGALVVEEPVDPGNRFGGGDIDPEKVGVHGGPDAGRWLVGFEIVDARRADFEAFTVRYVHRRLAIVVDGRVLAAPVIRSPLPGAGVITGGGPSGFSREDAESLAAVLISGAYPAEVRRR